MVLIQLTRQVRLGEVPKAIQGLSDFSRQAPSTDASQFETDVPFFNGRRDQP